ncbi:sigma 54-interacting transcriptional regulator [Myxococcota bacterium]|nr:sigma 54-interacting transcriptional regulator [Myxococcota bacterium]MBU1430349.1 sigma 54-interacting transcriptional regulator [Myxococcota bacterium]
MAFQRKIQGEAALKTIFVDDRPTARRLRKSQLVVLEGPEQGQALTIATEEVLVGRSAICDLTLTDASVSSRHFKIIAVDRGYILQDLGSTNGTFYGDIKIKEIYLRPGTVFRAGNTVLKFQPTDEVVTIELSERDRFEQVIGASIPMRAIFAHLERVAPSDLTVLLEGDTGTGKELIAQAIHQRSARAKKPMVVLDCSAIPKDLIESTLFGHEKGAFTGAIAQHKGVFEQADGGTIFLDEIGELDLSLQPKLLRVLENRELKRVGADRTQGVDVRVIAATNRDLRQMVTEGRFREDLYFRLSVMLITLPPLAARRADIPLLAEHFVKRANEQRAKRELPPLKLSPEASSYLKERPWPGNIRELKNAVDRATSLCEGVLITRQDLLFGQQPLRGVLPQPTLEQAPTPTAYALRFEVEIETTFKDAKQALLDEFEALYLKRLLEAHDGNISQSAKIAGLTRYHLRELLKKHAMHTRSGDGG